MIRISSIMAMEVAAPPTYISQERHKDSAAISFQHRSCNVTQSLLECNSFSSNSINGNIIIEKKIRPHEEDGASAWLYETWCLYLKKGRPLEEYSITESMCAVCKWEK